ncbi:hypothetical protein QFZ56_005991 [Streptomyces achromogenes]|uniref:Basic proline-rich protein n=1 Tax=Streptomyces achromogenes TaxID=67255 RepID=A0ABU0QB60_STRAH|nr:hypothetical protein [Streptomyces achromogenes]
MVPRRRTLSPSTWGRRPGTARGRWTAARRTPAAVGRTESRRASAGCRTAAPRGRGADPAQRLRGRRRLFPRRGPHLRRQPFPHRARYAGRQGQKTVSPRVGRRVALAAAAPGNRLPTVFPPTRRPPATSTSRRPHQGSHPRRAEPAGGLHGGSRRRIHPRARTHPRPPCRTHPWTRTRTRTRQPRPRPPRHRRFGRCRPPGSPRPCLPHGPHREQRPHRLGDPRRLCRHPPCPIPWPCPRSAPLPRPRRSGRPGSRRRARVPCPRWHRRTTAPTSRPHDRWAFPPADSCPRLSTARAVGKRGIRKMRSG